MSQPNQQGHCLVIYDKNGVARNKIRLHPIIEGGFLFKEYQLISDGVYDNLESCPKVKATLSAGSFPSPAKEGYDYMIRHNANDNSSKSMAMCILKMGTALAKRAGDKDLSNKYLASVFPAGYALVTHHVKNGENKGRVDTYVYGHPTGNRFRSVEEFAIHAAHLACDYNYGYDARYGDKLVDCTCCLCNPNTVKPKPVVKSKVAVKPKPAVKAKVADKAKLKPNSTRTSQKKRKAASKRQPNMSKSKRANKA